jgi:hypothetical protein
MSDETTTPGPEEEVEGHQHNPFADAERAEGDDDVEGHQHNPFADAERAEGDDDVEGHQHHPG